MAAHSNIEWTDATVNFWWGCTKVSPGCDHCYAEAWDKRTGGAHFGLNAPRRKIKSAVALLHKLDNQYAGYAADVECANAYARAHDLPQFHHRRRVFVQSMSDLFDKEVPQEWFAEAWRTIEDCDRIDIQLVTKRVSGVAKRLAEIGVTAWPRHAGLIISVANQQDADRDIPRLLALKHTLHIPWIGLSIEPLLGPLRIDDIGGPEGSVLKPLIGFTWKPGPKGMHLQEAGGAKIDWVIVGGESGTQARPMHPDWARSLRDQCVAAGVAFFFKQWGEWAPVEDYASERMESDEIEGKYEHFAGQSFRRAGKKAAGRLLDGRTWDEFPKMPSSSTRTTSRG